MTHYTPDVYLASKLHRAPFWREFTIKHAGIIRVRSTWHNSLTVVEDDANSTNACIEGWKKNLSQLDCSDALIAHVVAGEKPNGTLTEIGVMMSYRLPIYLVGDFEWGTWRHLPFVHIVDSVDEAAERVHKDYNR